MLKENAEELENMEGYNAIFKDIHGKEFINIDDTDRFLLPFVKKR